MMFSALRMKPSLFGQLPGRPLPRDIIICVFLASRVECASLMRYLRRTWRSQLLAHQQHVGMPFNCIVTISLCDINYIYYLIIKYSIHWIPLMSHDATLALKFNLNCVQKFNSSRPLPLYQEDADDSIASPTAKDAARQKWNCASTRAANLVDRSDWKSIATKC